jgi:hypothetical protein
MLESGFVTNPFAGSPVRHTNDVARYIAEARGLAEPGLWTAEVRRLAEDADTAFRHLSICDPALGSQQFVISLDDRQVRVQPFGAFGAFRLDDVRLSDGRLWLARSNVIQPSTTFSEESIHELEGLINGNAKESAFQRFFEANREFLLALGDYTNLHPQLVLHEDGGRLIPDFFLERVDSDLCDICDLKRPTISLVNSQRHRKRFRDMVMEGIAQLRTYRDWFDDAAHRAEFKRQYGLTAFRPRVVLILGRRLSFYDDVERIRMESDLPNWVQLKTYDDVVTRARRWRALMLKPSASPASA